MCTRCSRSRCRASTRTWSPGPPSWWRGDSPYARPQGPSRSRWRDRATPVKRRLGFSTQAVHGDPEARPDWAPVVTPLYQSATFTNPIGSTQEVIYARSGNNPNHVAIANRLALPEGGKAAIFVGSAQGPPALPHLPVLRGGVGGGELVIEEVWQLLRVWGHALAPVAAWLIDRGMQTLGVCVARQNQTALAVAQWCTQQPQFTAVHHPGLASQPDHDVAKRILDGLGGMVAVELKGGARAAERVLGAPPTAPPAPSPGGLETLGAG